MGRISELTAMGSQATTDLFAFAQSGVRTFRETRQQNSDWVVRTGLSFLPAGTGGTARTVQAALRQIVRDSDYDSVPNFNTAKAALTDTIGMATLEVNDYITAGGIITGTRCAARNDTNTTWPAIVIDNFSTGSSAEVAINFRKKNSSDVQLGYNITLGFGDTPNGGELNFESTDSTGAVRASPLSLMQDGRIRIGGFIAPGSLGSNVLTLVASSVATDKVLVVRGFASQSGELQIWQNDSAQGLAFITASGALACGGINQASVGAVRLPNNGAVVGRNAANNGDVQLILANAADEVGLAPGGNDIRWGKASVALGAGAAATLGTIGGSGPTVTTQNEWLRVITAAGNVRFIALWA